MSQSLLPLCLSCRRCFFIVAPCAADWYKQPGFLDAGIATNPNPSESDFFPFGAPVVDYNAMNVRPLACLHACTLAAACCELSVELFVSLLFDHCR